MSKIKDKMIQSLSASKLVQDDDNQLITLTQKQLFELLNSNGADIVINSSIVPSSDTIDVGSATKRFKTIYVDELNGAVAVYDLTVKGLLKVLGTTTTIDSENIQVKDNIIDINKDDIGGGVSKGTAGLRVLRGDLEPYYIVFDELDDLFKIGTANGLQVLATRDYVDQKIEEVKTYIDERINQLG